MITVLNVICFGLLTLLFAKTIAVWFLRFFKYKTLADRFCIVDSTDDEGLQIAKIFVKFFICIGYAMDVCALYTGEYSELYSNSMNISAIAIVTIVGGITFLVLMGALLTWHENIPEK